MKSSIQFKDYYKNTPNLLIEGFQELSSREQQQVLEAHNTFLQLGEAIFEQLKNEQLLQEGILDNITAKAKGAVAGIKQAGTNIIGGQGSGQTTQAASTQAQVKSLIDSLKKNVGTLTAKFKQDATSVVGKDSPILSTIQNMETSLNQAGIQAVDQSLSKQGKDAAVKVMGVVGKVLKPVVNKVNKLYEKSGPIKDFDNKYNAILDKINKKYPKLAEPMKKFSVLAKENKGKATFIIGALTALLTLSGTTGPFAPVVFGVLARGVYGMLAGEPPAKSFGKAALTAAAGKAAGAAMSGLFDGIGDAAAEAGTESGSEAGAEAGAAGAEAVASKSTEEVAQALGMSKQAFNEIGNIQELKSTLDPEQLETLQKAFAATDSSKSMDVALGKIDMLLKAGDHEEVLAKLASKPELLDQLQGVGEAGGAAAEGGSEANTATSNTETTPLQSKIGGEKFDFELRNHVTKNPEIAKAFGAETDGTTLKYFDTQNALSRIRHFTQENNLNFQETLKKALTDPEYAKEINQAWKTFREANPPESDPLRGIE